MSLNEMYVCTYLISRVTFIIEKSQNCYEWYVKHDTLQIMTKSEHWNEAKINKTMEKVPKAQKAIFQPMNVMCCTHLLVQMHNNYLRWSKYTTITYARLFPVVVLCIHVFCQSKITNFDDVVLCQKYVSCCLLTF